MAVSPSQRLADEFSRFEVEMRETALAIVREVFERELARRGEASPPARRSAPARDDVDAHPGASDAAAAAAPAELAPTPKRRGWTREQVIDELSTWLLSGTAVEASFVRRHGQPGLAAAAKRLFGRFDAALNAANLALSQRYPDGPPGKKAMSS